MRCQSAAAVLKKRRGCREPQEKPREGSPLRGNFDLLHQHHGQPVALVGSPLMINNHIRMLADFYGLDIRQVQRADRRVARGNLYVLAGEWFGRVYVDYIAERLEAEKLQ